MTLDIEKFKELVERTESNVEQFTAVAEETANKYTQDLDELMSALNVCLTQEEEPETVSLERYYLELTNMLYFMAQRVEKLNVYADIAKAQSKEVYNKSYLLHCSSKDEKGKSLRTVSENTALAEEESKYEATLETIYRSAYSIAKNKVNAGFEMVNTLRKVLGIRDTEMKLSMQPIRYTTSEGEE